MTTFQMIFTGVFVAFIIVGVIAFSLYTGNQNNGVGAVHIWGTADQGKMNEVIQTLAQQDKSFQSVSYTQKQAGTYTAEVINAMASGSGPDIILLSQDQISGFSNKLMTIPYGTVSQSSFTSGFIGEGRLFLTGSGSLALPFMVDPLVMYWNHDLFTSAGFAGPPKFWDDLLEMAPKLTQLGSGGAVQKSAIAMGAWDNIPNAKAVLSALFMQAGDAIIAPGASGNSTVVFGNTPSGATENPASSALQFYTEFANPSKVTYSWNRSLPNAEDAFVAGDLAVYIGFASEYAPVSARNPNLNFSVAVLPQIKGNSTRIVFGNLTGLAIPRTAGNAQGALVIAQKLSAPAGASSVASLFGLPSVRADATPDTSASATANVFYQSALIARGWLDPDPAGTADIFKTMINSVVSNKSLPDEAVHDTATSLKVLVPNIQ